MFPRPLIPASSVSVQAVLPPKKGQGDVGLGGTPLGPPAPVGVRRDGPGSAVPPSGLEKQRQWAAGGQVRRACQRAAVWWGGCEGGQTEAQGEKTASSERREAMGSSVYLQWLFLMEGGRRAGVTVPREASSPGPPRPSAPSTESVSSVEG